MATKPRPRATLIEPPKPLPHASPIETLLYLHPLTDISPTTFTNAYPLWRPPGARGLYGGATIAQSLAAAQATIPTDFVVHSMHCYFILAGDSDIPVVYEVEKIRDGHSFVTRTVQTRQRGRCICMTMISFMREHSGGDLVIEHQSPIPTDVEVPAERHDDDSKDASRSGHRASTPFEAVVCKISNAQTSRPEKKKVRYWMRAKGRINNHQADNGPGVAADNMRVENRHAHLSALSYVSDSFFLGTVLLVHNLVKNPREKEETAISKGTDNDTAPRKQVGMMVSLDHSIYFHNPTKFRADEWMLAEMTSPWAGEGRGFVSQKIWSKDGVLIATCAQEGLIRLKQGPESKL